MKTIIILTALFIMPGCNNDELVFSEKFQGDRWVMYYDKLSDSTGRPILKPIRTEIYSGLKLKEIRYYNKKNWKHMEKCTKWFTMIEMGEKEQGGNKNNFFDFSKNCIIKMSIA